MTKADLHEKMSAIRQQIINHIKAGQSDSGTLIDIYSKKYNRAQILFYLKFLCDKNYIKIIGKKSRFYTYEVINANYDEQLNINRIRKASVVPKIVQNAYGTSRIVSSNDYHTKGNAHKINRGIGTSMGMF